MGIKNQVQLITYPDSLGNNLKDLKLVLDTYIKDVIGGVHILPFYPSSADRGFCPLTHDKVDPKFGTWDDIRSIAKNYDLMTDLMINHLSSQSEYFLDYLKKGDKSKYKNLFLSSNDIFPDNIVDLEFLKQIYRPRQKDPFSQYEFFDGTKKNMWTTFTSHQIDLNWNSQITKDIMKHSIQKLAQNGSKIIRLDAVGYIIKKLRTNCFYLPEVYEIVNELKESIKEYDIKMLPEVHHHYTLQQDIAKKADLTYDFALPLLTLHTLYTSDAKALKNWIKIRPNNCVTTLDTHDGIGIIDVEDLLSKDELDITLSMLYQYGGNATYRASGESSDNVDIYQINCTYYSALNENDNAYLCARAIQFFLPGIPQVYYLGLFAGTNDVELLNQTNHGRDINRHYYTVKEIEQNLNRPVVKELFKLMKFRNKCEAFNGIFTMHETSDDILKLSWKKEDIKCTLEVDLNKFKFEIKEENKQMQINKS
jgi:sucrose phosphorylase